MFFIRWRAIMFDGCCWQECYVAKCVLLNYSRRSLLFFYCYHWQRVDPVCLGGLYPSVLALFSPAAYSGSFPKLQEFIPLHRLQTFLVGVLVSV